MDSLSNCISVDVPESLREMEQKAREFGENKLKVWQRLREAKACLDKFIKPFFRNALYDHRQKRLVGNGYYLQWQIREKEDEPIRYDNQQMSEGVVILRRDISPR